jgi:uncharacterized membrane protein YjjP (DUF1212 family)
MVNWKLSRKQWGVSLVLAFVVSLSFMLIAGGGVEAQLSVLFGGVIGSLVYTYFIAVAYNNLIHPLFGKAKKTIRRALSTPFQVLRQ